MTTLVAGAALGDRLMAEAVRLIASRRPEEARPLLRTASHDLGLIAAWPLLAEAELLLDDAEAALNSCAEGLERGGEAAALLTLRARAHGRLGRIGAALEDAAGAVHAAPRDEAARTVLGQALQSAGRLDEAQAVLGELWREAPEDAGRALRLADAMLAGGAHDAVAELTDWLAGLDLTPSARLQAAALAAQNALARGAPGEALERAWTSLAEGAAQPERRPTAALHSIAAHALIRLGRGKEAEAHLVMAHRLMPDDTYLAHLAAAAGKGQPERANDGYVRHLFDGYAAGFEASLLGLGYRAPGLILRLLEEFHPPTPLGDVLDLGCGTGLIGVVLHDRLAGELCGVDLSGAMLAEAAAKGVYTRLERADINGWLAAGTEPYSIVIAADVFCYFGALAETLAAIRARLRPDGLLLFSVEAMEEGGWALTGSGRYRHGEVALRAALGSASFDILALRREVLRQEQNAPLVGFLVAARAR